MIEREQLVLRPDQAVHAADAQPGGLGDVATVVAS